MGRRQGSIQPIMEAVQSVCGLSIHNGFGQMTLKVDGQFQTSSSTNQILSFLKLKRWREKQELSEIVESICLHLGSPYRDIGNNYILKVLLCPSPAQSSEL